MQYIESKLLAAKASMKSLAKRGSGALALVMFAPMAFAQTSTPSDPAGLQSAVLAEVGKWGPVAVAISIAFTVAIYTIRSARLGRRG